MPQGDPRRGWLRMQAVLAEELKKLESEEPTGLLPTMSSGPEAVGAPGTPATAQKA